MKINIYSNWLDTPANPKRPFKTVGSPSLYLSTQKHQPKQILARLDKIAKVPNFSIEKRRESGKYMVVLTDKNYENCLEGNMKEIHDFVRDCLSDAGYMSKAWGHKT